MKEPSVAGIRFFVAESSRTAGAPGKSKFQGTVTLTAHFNREDLWEAIIKRFHGLEMHRGGDIQSELIEILQGQVHILEEQLKHQATEDRERAQRAEQTASITSADAVRAKQHVELLQAQLNMRTRELEDANKANKAWQEWYDAHNRICHTPY